MLTIRSNGQWLHGLAPVGDIEYSTTWGRSGGGMLTLSWSMALPVGFAHPVLRQGSYVELCQSGLVIGAGIMAEPDRVNWKFSADGLHRVAEHFMALDDLGAPNTRPNLVVRSAVARGMPWVDPGTGADATLPISILSTDSQDQAQFNTVAQVLNQQAELLGQAWFVNPFGQASFQPDPTTVTWHLIPGIPAMATTDDDYASTQYVRYVSAVAGSPLEPSAWGVSVATDDAAEAEWGRREAGEDITNLGLASSTFADDTAAALLEAGKVRPAFAESLELSTEQITTPGGSPVFLPFVRAGQRVRHQGLLDSDGSISLDGVEWVIGSTSWKQGEPSKITIEPVGRQPRDLQAVIDDLVKKAQAKLA